MHPALEDSLKSITDFYNQRKQNKDLPVPFPERHKNLCLSALTARMEALDPSNEEYKECSFLAKALSNGWLVSDIEMLRAVYHTVRTVISV